MDRRKSLKSIVLGSVAGGLVLNGCKPEGTEKPAPVITAKPNSKWRTPEENRYIATLEDIRFFNDHERDTLTVLCDLILPGSDTYKSASDAEVVDFMEFMVKDIPTMQIDMRGGLMWLDQKSNAEFNKEFIAITPAQQKKILDEIAYYDPEVPQSERPFEVNFFSMVRNLTMTGFYTSKMGIEELGYKGNQPNVWDGVPEDVLRQHGVAYEEEWLAKCVDQSKREVIAEWDDKGNLLT